MRRFPRSRRHPHFNIEALTAGGAGRAYEHVPELGGRRRPHEGTPNDGWEVEAFRGYADHMGSEEFARGLGRLEALARKTATAFMCAEAPWWRCHRRLLADAFVARGQRVCHILDHHRAAEHELTEFAQVDDGRLTYPPRQLTL